MLVDCRASPGSSWSVCCSIVHPRGAVDAGDAMISSRVAALRDKLSGLIVLYLGSPCGNGPSWRDRAGRTLCLL